MVDPRQNVSPAGSSCGASSVEHARVASALRTAIAASTSASRADDLLRRALHLAGLHAVPRAPGTLRTFVAGPLLETVRSEIDESAARGLEALLEPTLVALSRIGAEPAAGEAALEPPSSEHEILLGVHAARIAIGIGVGPDDRLAIEGALPERATEWIGAFDRLEPTLRAHLNERRTILVECRRANPLVPRLVALDSALLDDALLVLWGASRIEELQVRRRFPNAVVLACARDATARDIATLIDLGAG